MDETKEEVERLEFLANVAASHGDTKTVSWAIEKLRPTQRPLDGVPPPTPARVTPTVGQIGAQMVAINQSAEPQELISLAKFFGFEVRVTGGLFLTHEIKCTQNDLIALREICPTLLAPDAAKSAAELS